MNDPERQFRALVLEHFDFVWRLLRRLGLSPADADDAAQHVFMTAVQKLDAIADGRQRPFLYGVALRVAQNHKRKLLRRLEHDGRAAREVSEASATPDDALRWREARELLDRLLLALPEELARVLVLAEIEELPVATIAELEGIPVGTAASRLRRARASFQEALAGTQAEHPFREAGT